MLSIILFFGCAKEERISTKDSPFQLGYESTFLEEDFECNCLDYKNIKEDYCVFNTSTIDNRFKIEYWSGYVNDWEVRPYFVSYDCLGNVLDTLYLSKKKCYNGTDSGFNPIIQLKKNFKIVVKSSRVYTEYGAGHLETRASRLVFHINHTSYLFTTTNHFVLDLNGYFKDMGEELVTETTSNY